MGRALRDAAPALAGYAGVRVLGLIGLALVAGANGQSARPKLQTWDAVWLIRIAEHGYDTGVTPGPGGRPQLTDVVFFPLMPAATRAVATVTGWSVPAAGLLVAALAGLAAAVAIDRIGRLVVGSRRAGVVLVALWASWPHAIVLSMVYSEALFVALAAWSLLAVLHRRWLTAGVLCLLAGATRPIGPALAVALVSAAVPVIGRAWRRPFNGGTAWRPVLACLLAPLGWLAFVGWVGHALGRADGWFWMERVAWLSHLDGGFFEWQRIRDTLTTPSPLVLVVASLIVLGCVVLLVALAGDLFDRSADRLGHTVPLLVYAGLVLAVTVATAGYHHSKPRLLLCAFPLLLPVARLIAAGPVRTAVVLLIGVAAASAWYGGYLLVLWTGSP